MSDEKQIIEEQIDPNSILNTVKRLDPDRAAKLEAFTKRNIDPEEAKKAAKDFNEKIEVLKENLEKTKKDVTMEDLKKIMEEEDSKRSIKETVKEVIDEERERYQADEEENRELSLEEITEENFTFPGYIDRFLYLTFERKLELLGVSKEDAAVVCDAVLMQGKYEKEIKLRSLVIKLSSREADVYQRALGQIQQSDLSRLQMMETLSLYNCAGSLVQYGDTTFAPLKEVAEDDREDYLLTKIRFLLDLPNEVYAIVNREVVKLDLLISTVTSEEGLKNL